MNNNLFFMKKLIKKILKEESEGFNDFDSFDWVRDTKPYELGSYFKEDDVCSDYYCKVIVTTEDVTFNLSFEEFGELEDESNSDNLNYLKTLLYHNGNYDGHVDHYDLDSEEFNYSLNYVSDDIRTRLDMILKDVNGSNFDSHKYFDDEMLNVYNVLKYIELKNYFDDLLSEFLNIVGYQVEKNRWLNLSKDFKDIVNELNVDIDLDWRDDLKITLPIDLLYNKYDGDLTNSIMEISHMLCDYSWYDSFWGYWDTDGCDGDVNRIFEEFISKCEDFLSDPELRSYYDEYFKVLESLGFEINGDFYVRINKNNTYWVCSVDFSKEMVRLKLFKGDQLSYSLRYTFFNSDEEMIRDFNIPIDELPNYVNNYSFKYDIN